MSEEMGDQCEAGAEVAGDRFKYDWRGRAKLEC